MKSSKKVLAILLAAMMATSMAACSSDEGSSSSESSASGSSSASSDASTASGESSSTSDPGEFTLPIAEGETLTMFMQQDGNAVTVQNDYNDLAFYQEMEKRTGVHIEFQMSSAADATTNFNLMIASNSLTDIIPGAANYADGFEAGIDDGYFLDLTPYLDEYMPNYVAFRTSNPEVEKDSITDSGRIAAVYQVFTTSQGPWLGPQVRQDWLDECGLDTPVTYDDWEEMLTAFKDQIGAYAPLSVTMNGYDNVTGWLSVGYNVIANWQLDETGKVTYGPYTDGWRQYITKMNDWFEKGLIDPDFMTQDAFMVDTTSVVAGRTGAWQSSYAMAQTYEMSSEDPDMNIVAVSPPRQNADDTLHLRYRDTWLGNATAISAQSDKQEIAMRWLDYLFTDDGYLLSNYGIEGDTFTFDENGDPVFTEKVTADPNLSFAQAQVAYTLPPASLACRYEWTRELYGVPEKDIESFEIWANDTILQDWTMPTLSLTKDESVERSSIKTDIETFAKEQTTQMITGVLDVETNWDSYISTIQSMGIEDAIAITQAAYDRYLQR